MWGLAGQRGAREEDAKACLGKGWEAVVFAEIKCSHQEWRHRCRQDNGELSLGRILVRTRCLGSISARRVRGGTVRRCLLSDGPAAP